MQQRDWLDYAGLIFDVLASGIGLFGLFLAIKAYRIAKSAGKLQFDLEILRELGREVERDDLDRLLSQPAGSAFNFSVRLRVTAIGAAALPFWWAVATRNSREQVVEVAEGMPHLHDALLADDWGMFLLVGLRLDLLRALTERTEQPIRRSGWSLRPRR